MEYAPEELLRYVLGVHVPIAEYAHALLAEDILQHSLTAFPISYPSYHPVRSIIVISISAPSSSLVLRIPSIKPLLGLLWFLKCASFTQLVDVAAYPVDMVGKVHGVR